MKTIHILNPAAGRGGAMKYKDKADVYITKRAGDARGFVKEQLCKSHDEINFAVYGGDGTLNEVVHGIVESGQRTAYVTPVPTGSGNDLVRTLNETGACCIEADILTVSCGVAVNAVNTGFDLSVAERAAQYKKKPFISGSMAYILGVITTLFGRYGIYMRIDYTDENGEAGYFEGECLLAVAGNGKYYGGGFKSSPAASINDGLIDLTVVKKVSRLKFISLVGKYKKGLHIDIEKGSPFKEFEDLMLFKKCSRVTISGIKEVCCDGEILKTDRAEIGVIPRAVRMLRRNESVREKECVRA